MTTSMVGLRNGHAKISPKLVNPRDRAGDAEEEEEWLITRRPHFPRRVTDGNVNG